ncbi:MAG: hypothetical protein GWN37_20215 [Gammaproteobacteria bacterium]|nr:hypothetical protein [Gammaproteobacteria bacterium]
MSATRPIPVPTPVSEPFWEGCQRGEFLLQHCRSCDAKQFYPRSVCSACGASDLAWRAASGEGQIVTYTVVRRAIMEAFAERVPYVVAIVRLAEGPQLMSHVIDCDPDTVRIGAAVRLDFERLGEDASLPVFRLA